MTKKRTARYILLTGFIFLLSFVFVRYADAANVISDSANLLSAEEKEELQSYCSTITEQYDTSVYIVTSNKTGSQDDYEAYMEQTGTAADAPKNLVLLFVSTKKGGRITKITGFGDAASYMTPKRCSTVISYMQKDLNRKNYFSAFKTFCEQTQRYLGKNPKFDSFIFRPVPQFIFSLLLSLFFILLVLGEFDRFTRKKAHHLFF